MALAAIAPIISRTGKRLLFISFLRFLVREQQQESITGDNWQMFEIDRRTFLGASALALASRGFAADPAPWFDRPMRWAQLTLVEDDPAQYDVNFWLDYFRRTHSDAT